MITFLRAPAPLIIALAVLALAFGSSESAHASDDLVLAEHDTYTTSTLPNRVSGSALKVAVGHDGDAEKVGYLRFPGPVTEGAALRLDLDVLGGQAGVVDVYWVVAEWTQGSLVVANSPVVQAKVGSLKLNGGQESVSLNFVAYRNADDVALALKRVDRTGVSRFASLESQGEGRAARLVRLASATSPGPNSPECSISAKLVPTCGLWLGVAPNPIESESFDQAMLDFEKTIGRTADVARYYIRGQGRVWPTPRMIERAREEDSERILAINWKPSGLTWREVAEGAADAHLRKVADHINQNFHEPFFLSLNAEMEDEVVEAAGSGQNAKDYAAFFRHVVTILRNNGVDNLITIMNYTGTPNWPKQPWFNDLYPGDDVVDWIAQDPYAFDKPPVWLTDFRGLVDRRQSVKSSWPGFYSWAVTNFPDKPQMLAEWGIHESQEYPEYKADFFDTMLGQMEEFPKIKALIYWNAPRHPKVGLTRVDSTPGSLRAFRAAANSPALTDPGEYYRVHLR